MRMVTREGIERLLSANPIGAVAAERGITLHPLGQDLGVGRCPLHGGPGRSLLVEKAGRFRCLVCSLHGGNAIGLVMQLDHLGFLDAVVKLAERAGLDLDVLMGTKPRPRPQRSDVPWWALTPPHGLSLVDGR